VEPPGRGTLLWMEWAFRLVGVAFMAAALLSDPVDPFLFLAGALNYLFSLYVMKKRRETASPGRACRATSRVPASGSLLWNRW